MQEELAWPLYNCKARMHHVQSAHFLGWFKLGAGSSAHDFLPRWFPLLCLVARGYRFSAIFPTGDRNTTVLWGNLFVFLATLPMLETT